jgi:hypothetical protein
LQPISITDTSWLRSLSTCPVLRSIVVAFAHSQDDHLQSMSI